MANFIMTVNCDGKPGREAEYRNWYQSVHLPETCAVPGVTSGRCFEAQPFSPHQPSAPFFALYEIDADPGVVMAELGRRRQAGEMQVSDALDPASVRITFYKPR